MLNFDLTPEKYKKLKDLYINAIYNDKKHFKFENTQEEIDLKRAFSAVRPDDAASPVGSGEPD